MSWPLISVIIPAFNAGGTIDRALASVFVQDYHPLEIIVIDDGSTDDTAARVAGYRDDEVRLLRLEANRGVAAATNAGLAMAKGEFIAFLDADDEWLPRKLRTQLPLLMQSPEMSFVCSPWREVRLSGTHTIQPALTTSPPPYSKTVWRVLLARSFVLKSTVIARTANVLSTGGFDETLLVAEDQDMWIKLAVVGAVGWHPEPLAVHHETANSLTKRYALREKDFVLPMIERHLRAQEASLSPEDIRWIRGTRYAQIGRSLYQGRQGALGVWYLFHAIVRGIQPAEHLAFIVIASAPIRWIRHRLRSTWRRPLCRRPSHDN